MIRRSFRFGLWLGALSAIAYAVSRARTRAAPPVVTRPQPAAPTVPAPVAPPAPPATVTKPVTKPAAKPAAKPVTKPVTKPVAKPPTKPAAKTTATVRTRKRKAPAAPAGDGAWVDPTNGTCPGSHPVKAKLSSKIFHVVGGLNYERTLPDRCFVDAAAAEAAGFRPAKR